MSSTEHRIGLDDQRASSRVLKPPGGGHSNIFGQPDEIKPHARPKYDQQNSSNLNFCMNTVDPNEKVTRISGGAPEMAPATEVDAVKTSAPSSFDAPEPAKCDDAQKQAENLPAYHHHRSTALW